MSPCDALDYLRRLRSGPIEVIADEDVASEPLAPAQTWLETWDELLSPELPRVDAVVSGAQPLARPEPIGPIQLAARPGRARGLTKVVLTPLAAWAIGDLFLRANPMRRAFAACSTVQPVKATPNLAQALLQNGWDLGFHGRPADIITEEVWGAVVWDQWFHADGFATPDFVVLYEEVYLQ